MQSGILYSISSSVCADIADVVVAAVVAIVVFLYWGTESTAIKIKDLGPVQPSSTLRSQVVGYKIDIQKINCYSIL